MGDPEGRKRVGNGAQTPLWGIFSRGMTDLNARVQMAGVYFSSREEAERWLVGQIVGDSFWTDWEVQQMTVTDVDPPTAGGEWRHEAGTEEGER